MGIGAWAEDGSKDAVFDLWPIVAFVVLRFMARLLRVPGTQDIHKELEKKIASFHGMEDAILFPSGFDANAGLFEAERWRCVYSGYSLY